MEWRRIRQDRPGAGKFFRVPEHLVYANAIASGELDRAGAEKFEYLFTYQDKAGAETDYLEWRIGIGTSLEEARQPYQQRIGIARPAEQRRPATEAEATHIELVKWKRRWQIQLGNVEYPPAILVLQTGLLSTKNYGNLRDRRTYWTKVRNAVGEHHGR